MILDTPYTGFGTRVTGYPPDGEEFITGAFRLINRHEDGSALLGNGEDPETIWAVPAALFAPAGVGGPVPLPERDPEYVRVPYEEWARLRMLDGRMVHLERVEVDLEDTSARMTRLEREREALIKTLALEATQANVAADRYRGQEVENVARESWNRGRAAGLERAWVLLRGLE